METPAQHSTARLPFWRAALWGTIAAVLLSPAVAMQFTAEVDWTRFDFLVAALLLVGAGVIFEVAARWTTHPNRRVAIGAALLLIVAVIWLEGAVGIF